MKLVTTSDDVKTQMFYLSTSKSRTQGSQRHFIRIDLYFEAVIEFKNFNNCLFVYSLFVYRNVDCLNILSIINNYISPIHFQIFRKFILHY